MTRPPKEFVEQVMRSLLDKGKIIEAGWESLRLTVVPTEAPAVQVGEMRMAFFAGAAHLFSSIMIILEPDAEPTENDLKRMNLIHKELRKFEHEFALRAAKAGGHG